MKPKGMELAWVTVKDIKGAIKFYTETVGLKLAEFHEHYGWAELTAPNGMRLGLAQQKAEIGDKAGSNAVVTITVDDINASRNALKIKHAKLVGEVLEVPGEVKMQTFCDPDGNTFQICQLLRKE